ncbi:MAG: hypothetical protein QOD06_2125 [Candidatus Binatota bacterium]|nr:hypothetical protein [Candidatus Binatota bacterium]
MLADLAIRSFDLDAFYTADAALPAEYVNRLLTGTGRWSLHLLAGSPQAAGVLFLLSGLAAAAMLVGYETRIATAGSWILLTSLQNRSPLLGNDGDDLLRLLLLWGSLLPLGARASMDDADRPSSVPRARGSTVACAAILLQICWMYGFSGIWKLNAEWLSGHALQEFFSASWFAQPSGRALVRFPTLTKSFTFATVAIQLAAPFLLLSPWRTDRTRLVGLGLLVPLHILLDRTLRLGWFSYVCLVALTLFIPTSAWDRLVPARRLSTATEIPPRIGGDDVVERGLLHRAWAIAVGALALFVLVWNLATLPSFGGIARILPSGFWWLGGATALAQKWSMLEHPPRGDLWYVAFGTTQIPSAVDVLTGGIPDPQKPEWPSARLPNQNWRHLFWRLNAEEFKDLRETTASFLCRRWNSSHRTELQLEEVRLISYGDRRNPKDPSDPVSYPYVRWTAGGPCRPRTEIPPF